MIFWTLAGYIFGFILFLFSLFMLFAVTVSVFRVIKKIFLNNKKEKKMEKQIIIFLKNGETLLFQDVSNVDVTDEYIAFDYFGKSTNQEKSGAFFFDNIAGWSASADLLE